MSNYSASDASVAWTNVEGTSWKILVEPPSSVIGIWRYSVDIIKYCVIHFSKYAQVG